MTPEQLEQRRSLITATDAPAILGLHPNRSVHDVYAAKLGLAQSNGQTWRMRRGLAVEPAGLAWLAEQRKIDVMPCGTELRVHPILTWLGASPDGLVLERGAPVAAVEVKTAGLGVTHLWDDEDGEPRVPDHYLVQVAVQLLVTRLPRAVLVADIATEEEPRLYDVERDPDLEAIVLEECDRFRREHLEPRIPPPPDGSESARQLLLARFPRPTRDMLTATPETTALAEQWIAARTREEDARRERRICEAQLCAVIGEHEGIRGDGWRALWGHREETRVEAYTRKAHRVFDVRQVKR